MSNADKDSMIESKEISRFLPVPLTRDEREEYTSQMIDALDQLESLESEKKSFNEQHKGRVAKITDQVGTARSVLKRDKLDKDVPCLLIKDYREGSVTIVRKDTGEQIEQKAMSLKERQKALEFNTDDQESKPQPESDSEQNDNVVPLKGEA